MLGAVRSPPSETPVELSCDAENQIFHGGEYVFKQMLLFSFLLALADRWQGGRVWRRETHHLSVRSIQLSRNAAKTHVIVFRDRDKDRKKLH